MENDTSCKEKKSSLLSYYCFSYIDQLIAIGMHEPIKEDELDELLPGTFLNNDR